MPRHTSRGKHQGPAKYAELEEELHRQTQRQKAKEQSAHRRSLERLEHLSSDAYHCQPQEA